MILKTEHHQQLGDSFDYSNSDLHNVINIGRNAKTVILNKGEDHEEVEAFSPTSNYRIPDIYGYNSRKRRRNKATPPSQPMQSTTDSTHQKIHSKCFLHPKGKHSIFQCSTLREALRVSANKDNKEKVNTSNIPFQQGIQHASYSKESSIGLTPSLTPNKG